MELSQIIAELEHPRVSGPGLGEVSSITCDSRTVQPGTLFAAIHGGKSDGNQFIGAALENGATAIVSEHDVPANFRQTWIQVHDARAALADAASAFFGHPSHHVPVMGVTGTNGKTTTAFIAQHLVAASRGRCGLIGTVQYDVGGKVIPASRTTPDPVAVQSLLAQMRDRGCAAVSMEVSSHALDQHRVRALEFDAAVFTNLTQDHLDYHKTMESYFAAKAKLFEHLAAQKIKTHATAVLNLDDLYGKRLAAECRQRLNVLTFGITFGADFHASDARSTLAGTTFALEARSRSFLVKLPLLGRFNVANALGALAGVYAMGFNLREAVANLATTPQVPGRLQSVGQGRSLRIFVDYAHTPDALENVLRTLRELSPRRIITLFGCGGDRDVSKRPLMAAAAEALSDFVILTSDNPRSENPASILEEIEKGLRRQAYEKIEDRKEAIGRAIELAGEGDIVLLAGKGHEAEQQFADRTIAFDDAAIAESFLRDKRYS